MTTLDQEKFKKLGVSLPPIEEQRAITNYLDNKMSKLDLQKKKIILVVERLTEYRSALITNAVTGKIDVRDFQIPNRASKEEAHA